MSVKCRNCGANIDFKKSYVESPEYLNGMFVKGKTRYIPINELDNQPHTCKKLVSSFSDPRMNYIICEDCERTNHFWGVSESVKDWLIHSKTYGHLNMRKWSPNELVPKTCKCIKYCYGK